jgi:ketosteroid isomerase-like protein
MKGTWVLMALVLCLATFPCATAKAQKAEVVAEVQQMLLRHDKALNQQDLAGVMETYAPGPKSVLMGVAPGEWWAGFDEIKDAYSTFFEDFDKGTLTTDCFVKKGDVKGDMGWLMAMCKFTDSLKGEIREYGINISAVLEKIDDQWYFRTFHYSNLTGDQ